MGQVDKLIAVVLSLCPHHDPIRFICFGRCNATSHYNGLVNKYYFKHIFQINLIYTSNISTYIKALIHKVVKSRYKELDEIITNEGQKQ